MASDFISPALHLMFCDGDALTPLLENVELTDFESLSLGPMYAIAVKKTRLVVDYRCN